MKKFILTSLNTIFVFAMIQLLAMAVFQYHFTLILGIMAVTAIDQIISVPIYHAIFSKWTEEREKAVEALVEEFKKEAGADYYIIQYHSRLKWRYLLYNKGRLLYEGGYTFEQVPKLMKQYEKGTTVL